jgi:D-amino-acid oxidase
MPRRRDFLQHLATAASVAGLSCVARKPPQTASPTDIRSRRSFAPVHASSDRVTRTVVGLRPFRPSGFVVRAEKTGGKTIVHNYGHGGGGMTLSWGTAFLAVELALPLGQSNIAVVGCGGVGLATARLLQRKGCAVTIYARDLPPETTSNISGAQWLPVSVFAHDSATPEFLAQFIRAAHISNRYFQAMLGDYYGVRWLPNYLLSDEPLADGMVLGANSPLRDLYPEFRDLGRDEHPFDARYALQFDTMMIEPPIYLNAVLRDFYLAGGRVVVREFSSRDDVLALPEPVVMNCTGLGAGALFDDRELTPVKGQLTVLLPQPEVDYAVIQGELYMFPRRDGILLGGTHERGEWSLEPNLEAQKRIMEGHRQLFGSMRLS